MKDLKIKTLNRIKFISSNALRQILVSVFGMIIPFMVIQYSSKEIWGEFVSILLYTLFAIQIINWGNKEYLLRKFSLEPNKIIFCFSKNIFTRLPLLLFFSVVGFFYFQLEYGIFIFLWLFGRLCIHSTEVLIIYEKKFNTSLIIESLCFAIFCLTFFVFKSEINLKAVLIFYSFYQLFKGLCYYILFKDFISLDYFEIDLNYYKSSFWFFLLSIFGFLASKIDVYIIELFGNKIVTSEYQIINSLLVFVMSSSAFIYVPFVKNIYRNNELLLLKSKKILAFLGLIIVPISLVIIYFILSYFLNLQLSIWFYLIAFFYVYPSFIYGLEIVNLFKQQQEKKVVLFLFFGTIANSLLSALFLHFNYGINDALFGSAIAQLLVLILFKFKKNV